MKTLWEMRNHLSLAMEKFIHLPLIDQPFWLRSPLWSLSLLYQSVVSLRNFCYDHGLLRQQVIPAGKVVSIGNISVGGTGKTPVTIELATRMQASAVKVAVLTRGYRSGLKHDQCVVLKNGRVVFSNGFKTSVQHEFHGDEALLMSVKCPDIPIIVGARRYAAACFFLQSVQESEQPELWLLEDGFQHRKIGRDLDIVLCDHENSIGNGRCLPAGPLREKPSSLQRADFLLMTRSPAALPPNKSQCNLAQYTHAPIMSVPFSMGELISIANGQRLSLQPIERSQMKVLVCSAIADTSRLLADIRKRYGIKFLDALIQPDHQFFSPGIVREKAQGHDLILLTEKDFYRQQELFYKLEQELSAKVALIPLAITLPPELLPHLLDLIKS